MKLFASTQISWSEPWFFLLRIREPGGWLRRGLLALAIAVVMFVAMYYFGQQPSIPIMLLGSVGAGLVLVAAMDLPNIQRDVTVQEDCIIVGSTAGRGRFTTINFKVIEGVQIVRPDEWEYRWAGMVVDRGEDGFLTAIPHKVNLETLANVLHRLELPVALTGWEPSDSDTRVTVKDTVEIDPQRVSGGIQIATLDASEPKLLTPVHITIQVIVALGPLLLSLIGAIIAGIYLYQNWDAVTAARKVAVGGGAAAAVIITFMYLMRIGQFIMAAYGIKMARGRMQLRANSPFAGTEDDLVTVELFDRESWTATICKSADFGFLRIDRSQRQLIFEGDKNRWNLPFGGIAGCRIEESIVGSEGNENAERRYYVVLETENVESGGPWEMGFVYTRTETGSDNAETRYARSHLLYMQLADAIT